MTDVLINQLEWLADNFIHTLTKKLVTTFRVGELADGFQRVVIVLHMEILFRNVNPNGAEVKMELELHPSDELCEHEAAKWTVQVTVFIDEIDRAFAGKLILNVIPFVWVIIQK